MKIQKNVFRLTALASFVALSACGGGGGSSDKKAQQGWKTNSAGQVQLQFAAYAGTQPIKCGDVINDLGTSAKKVQIQDFRFFISNVKLIRADGSSEMLKLPANDDYHYTSGDGSHRVTLVDLEQKDGALCKVGTETLNPIITGTVPAGNYVGVEMQLGVPAAINHSYSLDAGTPAVLRTDVHPGMSWSWRGGRKFTKIELKQDPSDKTEWENGKSVALLHLGSTGCVGNPAKGIAVSGCKAPNRLPLRFASFNPQQQQIAVDVKALFADNDVGSEKSGGVCMSGPTDPACPGIFKALALSFNLDGSGTGTPLAGQQQRVFKPVAKP